MVANPLAQEYAESAEVEPRRPVAQCPNSAEPAGPPRTILQEMEEAEMGKQLSVPREFVI